MYGQSIAHSLDTLTMLTAIVKECATFGAAFSVLQQLSFH